MRARTDSGLEVVLRDDGTWKLLQSAENRSQEGFRKSLWGASISQVKTAEGREPRHEGDGYLDFEVQLGRFRCLAVYIFVADRLVRGKYLLFEEYQNQTNYLTAYDELNGFVSKKYGSAIKDDTFWLNDLYRGDYTEWGMAVSCGHLSKFANWETPESTINVALYGENFEVTVSVEYAGKAFADLEDSVNEAALLGDL